MILAPARGGGRANRSCQDHSQALSRMSNVPFLSYYRFRNSIIMVYHQEAIRSQEPANLDEIEQALKQYFGHDNFLAGQREIIEDALSGRDAFVLMPTGAGKSLIYQFSALLLPGLTVVISPLIALMQDQVDRLRANGIAATFVNSMLSPAERLDRDRAALNVSLNFLYAP